MISGAGFFFYRSFRNQARYHLRRLRSPKYLVSAIVGLLYFYLVFFRQVFDGGARGDRVARPGLADLQIAEIGFAALLLLVTLAPWFSKSRGSGVIFSEAEIQFLFPAPVSRRDLLHLRMCRAQLPILFSVLLTALIFGRNPMVAHTAYLVLTLWVVYSFLSLYRMATFISKLSLAEHGVSAVRRQIGFLILLGGVVLSIGVWLFAYLPAPPTTLGLEELSDWLSRVAETGLAFYLLLPFRALVRPAFSSNWTEFLGRLGPSLFLLFLTYRWVIRSDVSFQEAALEESEKTVQKLAEAKRRGIRPSTVLRKEGRRAPFGLRATGMPHVAIFWKNLISAGRFGPRRLRMMLLIIGALVVCGFLWPSPGGRRMISRIIGSTAGGLAVVLSFIGPLVVRDDLRSDLLHIDELKTYPVAGWGIVLGEVLAPATVIAAQEWMLIILAFCFFPAEGRYPLIARERIALGIAAALLLPLLSLLGLIAHNAAALFMPGWIHLGKDEQQGVEATGQRLISLIAVTAVLGLAVLPAALAFIIVYLASHMLLGAVAIPMASFGAALTLALEAGILVVWLGRVFDRLDPSVEMLGMRT